MEIERINDNTVKFYVSYLDIEERGFDREEIWYNRDRSEELFWEMMDEVHQEEDFTVEGPLWIQVQALDKGLEILVTKAQVTKDGQRFELPIPEDKLSDMPLDQQMEEMLDEHFQMKPGSTKEIEQDLDFVLTFDDFEDVISLSKHTGLKSLPSKLFAFENHYFLYVEFLDEEFPEEEIDNFLSILLEFGHESPMTLARLEEYGVTVANENALETIKQHFN